MEGGREGKFYEARLGVGGDGELSELVTGRFLFMEMCLAWGKSPREMEALSSDERTEMWLHFTWRQERERLLREKAEMQQKQYLKP